MGSMRGSLVGSLDASRTEPRDVGSRFSSPTVMQVPSNGMLRFVSGASVGAYIGRSCGRG